MLPKLGTAVDSTDFGNVAEIQPSSPEHHKFVLSWSHYLILMRVKDANARSFYEIECAKQNWSIHWLQRQVNSSLYELLALSKDKDEVIRMATEGQVVEKPADIIKNPITLEFLGLRPEVFVQYCYDNRFFLPLNKKDWERIDSLLSSAQGKTLTSGDLAQVAHQLQKGEYLDHRTRYRKK